MTGNEKKTQGEKEEDTEQVEAEGVMEEGPVKHDLLSKQYSLHVRA
jgi:hypothetical protein